jgi:hypothetical protein
MSAAVHDAHQTIEGQHRQIAALKREFEAAKVAQAQTQSELSSYKIKSKAAKDKLQHQLQESEARARALETAQSEHQCENGDVTELRLQLHAANAALEQAQSLAKQFEASLNEEIERSAMLEGHHNPKQRIHLHQQIKLENNTLKAENSKLRVEITQLLAGSHPVQIKKLQKAREKDENQKELVAAARARKENAGKAGRETAMPMDIAIAEQENDQTHNMDTHHHHHHPHHSKTIEQPMARRMPLASRSTHH